MANDSWPWSLVLRGSYLPHNYTYRNCKPAKATNNPVNLLHVTKLFYTTCQNCRIRLRSEYLDLLETSTLKRTVQPSFLAAMAMALKSPVWMFRKPKNQAHSTDKSAAGTVGAQGDWGSGDFGAELAFTTLRFLALASNSAASAELTHWMRSRIAPEKYHQIGGELCCRWQTPQTLQSLLRTVQNFSQYIFRLQLFALGVLLAQNTAVKVHREHLFQGERQDWATIFGKASWLGQVSILQCQTHDLARSKKGNDG